MHCKTSAACSDSGPSFRSSALSSALLNRQHGTGVPFPAAFSGMKQEQEPAEFRVTQSEKWWNESTTAIVTGGMSTRIVLFEALGCVCGRSVGLALLQGTRVLAGIYAEF